MISHIKVVFTSCDIQMLGRWQNMAYKTYIRKSDVKIIQSSIQMINTPVIHPNTMFLFQNITEQDLLV